MRNICKGSTRLVSPAINSFNSVLIIADRGGYHDVSGSCRRNVTGYRVDRWSGYAWVNSKDKAAFGVTPTARTGHVLRSARIGNSRVAAAGIDAVRGWNAVCCTVSALDFYAISIPLVGNSAVSAAGVSGIPNGHIADIIRTDKRVTRGNRARIESRVYGNRPCSGRRLARGSLRIIRGSGNCNGLNRSRGYRGISDRSAIAWSSCR